MPVGALVSDNEKRLRGRRNRDALFALLRGLLGAILRRQRARGEASEVFLGKAADFGRIDISGDAQRHVGRHIVLLIKSLRVGTAEVLDVAGPSTGHVAVGMGGVGGGRQGLYQLALRA